MNKLLWAFLAVGVPAAYAVPIYISISFTGTGSVAGAGFSGQTVTVTAIADTTNVSFPAGSTRPSYAPPTSFSIAIPGFGTGTATNLPGVAISSVESQGLGSFLLSYQSFVYLALNNAAFATWNLQTSLGPIALSGDSTQGFVQLDNNDVWGTEGIGTSIGNVQITFAQNATVTASLGAPDPVTIFSPVQGATSVSVTPVLTWTAAAGAASYGVYLGTSTPPPFLANTTATTYSPAALTANTTYYWSLVSENGAGSTPSAIWSFTTGESGHPSFFNGEVYLGSGVYYLQFPNSNIFGYYNYQYFPILYHYDMGFESFVDANDGQGGAYLYDFASGHWFYTSPSYPFPYLYDFTLQTVLYYYPNTASPGHYTSNPRYFYDYAAGQIITM